MSTDLDHRAPLARGPAVITAVGAVLVFVGLASVLVPWDWVPGGDLTPVRAGELFTPSEIARIEEYSTARRYLGWSSYGITVLVAVALGLTPMGARLVHRVGGRLRWWLAVPVGVLAVLLVGRLATLPLSLLIRELNLDYGLTRQPLGDWFVDYTKSLLVSVVLASLVLLVLVGSARRWPRYWFGIAGGAAATLLIAGSFLYPVVVEPLFNKFTPMSAGPFKSSVFRLAEAEQVEIDDVLVADASRRTTTLNAYVSGFGGTRRVVVYDNLLKEVTPDEARVVIAHELAHAKHNDVLTGTALGAVGAVLGIALLGLLLDSGRLRRRAGVTGPADPAVVALVLALTLLATLTTAPVQNTISRAIEARADREAISATGKDAVFVNMQRELALHSLNDPTPPLLSQFWFGSHPTVLQRAGLPTSLEASR